MIGTEYSVLMTSSESGYLPPPLNDGSKEVLMNPPGSPGRVTLNRLDGLTDAEREEIRQLALAVYAPEDATDWPGQRIDWSTPEWCVRVRDTANRLVSHVGVYVRQAKHDGRPVLVGGIGNVKTHPDARGQGFAALAIQRAIDFFHEQPGVGFALLVCEPTLLGYYARFGWREFSGRLLVRQHGEPCEFSYCRVMTRDIGSDAPFTGEIDLEGPPW